MSCIKCSSDDVISVSAKCGDLVSLRCGKHEYDGGGDGNTGVPEGILGGGDYLRFSFCCACGQIQDKFPVDPKSIVPESFVHLKLTRGGNACGIDKYDGPRNDPDIEMVTCPECLEFHNEPENSYKKC